MNIESTIEIYAGGQGSGPNAPCPQCGPKGGVKEGDRVKFAKDHTVTSTGGAKYKFQPDTVAKVISVMPKIGHGDQMVGVLSEKDQKEGKFGNVGYVKMDDLILHEPRHSENPYSTPSKMTRSGNFTPAFDKQGKVIAPDPHAVVIKPVPKDQVIMHTITPDGASLTWIKTPQHTEEDIKNISKEAHSLKGKFNLLSTVPAGELNNPGEKRVTRVYDTTRTPLESRSVNKGATVWVSGLTSGGKITGIHIKEQLYGKHAQIENTYEFKYKNAAAGIGMLKSRYGIVTSLKRLRGGG